VDVAGGAEQWLLEVLATQDDDSAGFDEEAGGAAYFFLATDRSGAPRMATSSMPLPRSR
jgi:hypothetical protein